MRRAIACLIFVIGCGTEGDLRGTCRRPAAIEAGADAGSGACTGLPGIDACEVSGAVATCTHQCTPSQFGLSCADFATPDATLGCAVVAIPTPVGVTLYCCPCLG